MTAGATFDCALFDIDGVLVDIRKSYNEAIKKTVEFVLEQTGKGTKKSTGQATAVASAAVTDRLILRFRQSGGFNNDTDTSYAIALALMANPQQSAAKARKFLEQVAENADETGIVSVEKFLAPYGIEKHKELLAYPAPVNESYIGRVFDELFYGPGLFEKQNGSRPKYCRPKRPFIANDRLVVSRKTMEALRQTLGDRLAIVSGRSRLAAEYSLRPVWKYFNLDACVFLEDEPREHAKPNPYAVKRAMSATGARTAVYAGDSAEDMMMARRAQKEAGYDIAFVGIYGFSPQPALTVRQFKEQGADAVARDVNALPKLLLNLNKVKPA
ncbi:HAD-IA family hydrolase [Nitrososphaera sp.]|uniref:HAD family hydrolase n=1 Tax=Nitrososphaera sp. TaxID=1971748 RepID=UPI00307EBB79